MKKNKKLQEFADKSLNKFDDTEFLHKLEAKVQEQPKRHMTQKTKNMIFAFASCVLVFAIVLTCIAVPVFSQNTSQKDNPIGGNTPDIPSPPPAPPHTDDDNDPLPDPDIQEQYSMQASSSEELALYSKYTLDLTACTDLSIQKALDNQGDILFFSIAANTRYENIKRLLCFTVIVQEGFDFDEQNPVPTRFEFTDFIDMDYNYNNNYDYSANISQYELLYNQSILEEKIYLASGEINSLNQKMYIAIFTVYDKNTNILEILTPLFSNAQ